MGFTQKPNPYDELVQQCMQIMRKDDRVSRMFQDYQMDTHVHIKSLDPLEIQFRIQNDRKQGVVEARYKQDKDSRILQKLSISDGTKTMTLFDRNPPTHPRKWFQLGFF
ncbi:hypothetical protein EDD86DRAFT_248575 [Gorgonomyces haynaldii]|nr:hypothetical protein EDD86DRAFT_248575 [Gorgonomyces haynaldii]